MAEGFWQDALIVIFFIYGLAFYSLGLALLVESGRSSELTLARTILLLSGFGFLHGTHEWLDMLDRGLVLYYDRELPTELAWIRLSLLVASFLALLAFGEGMLRYEPHRKRPSWRLTIGALGWYLVSAIVVYRLYDLSEGEWVVASGNLARYVIGIPGALLACIALWRQRAIFQERGMGLFAKDLTLAAISLALYGIVGQFMPAKSVVFPSNIINQEAFFDIFGFPIQVFRTAMAAVVAFSMIRVLRALEVENRQRLAAVERAKLEAEQRSHQELTQLNQELREANEEIAHLLEEVRRREALRGVLLQRTTAAQEAERQRIARELHDETGQALTGFSMGLRGMTGRLARLGHDDLARQLETLEGVATVSLSELRLLINDLRPPQLDELGLVAALRWLINRFKSHYGLEVKLRVDGDPIVLSPEVETTLFRIAQEGLTNIGKHAGACHAGIHVCFEDGLLLRIWDDGKGFDPQAAFDPETPRTAWGLLGMQERATLVNAQLSLESDANKGTMLTIHLSELAEGS